MVLSIRHRKNDYCQLYPKQFTHIKAMSIIDFIQRFSRNRKEKLDSSVYLPPKIKHRVFRCQQLICIVVRFKLFEHLSHMLLPCHTPQHTNLIMEQVSAFTAHHTVDFTLSCVALLLHRGLPPAYSITAVLQVYFYNFTLGDFKHSLFTLKGVKTGMKILVKILNFNSIIENN